MLLGGLATDGEAQGLDGQLIGAGFDADTIPVVRTMFRSAAQRLLRLSEASSRDDLTLAFWVPGRIEVLGKHTDYAGGCSLLGAVNRGFAVVTTARLDGNCRVLTQFSDGRELQQTLALTDDVTELERLRSCSTDEGGWAAYPAAVIQRLVSNFGITRGCNISIECSLPEASGMSSSSAVICYMWLALDAYNGISAGHCHAFEECMGRDPAERTANLYTYLGNVENGKDFHPVRSGSKTLAGVGGVGTFGGSEDHTAIMGCVPGELAHWSFCPTRLLGTVRVDTGVRFVVAVSGAKAEKIGGAMAHYNDACLLALWAAAAYALGRWKSHHGHHQFAATNATSPPFPRTPLSRSELAELYNCEALFNPSLPNLAECVRCERATANTAVDPADLRERVSEVIRSAGEEFRTEVKALFGNALGVDGIERVTIGDLVTRFEQFFDESEVLVHTAVVAFAAREYDKLGDAVDSSHALTVSKLRNTIPETAWLPRWARGLEGEASCGRVRALASSAFGAGFGGSCWALVRTEEAEVFKAQWSAAYEAAFPPRGGGLKREFFIMAPGPGAFQIEAEQ